MRNEPQTAPLGLTRWSVRGAARTALWALPILAFIDAVFNYFSTGNGIHGSEGALLVIASTLLMAIAAALIASRRITGWLLGLFEFLILLDFLGTALAAYFLEAWILLALVVLALIGWIAHFARPATTVSTAG